MSEKTDITETIRTVIKNSEVSVSANVKEEYIITTEDKVKILYNEYNTVRKGTGDIFSWFGIFLALLIADVTCDFKPFWMFDSQTIKAMFLWSTILFFVLMLRSVFFWKKNKEKLEYKFFIEELRGNTTVKSNNEPR